MLPTILGRTVPRIAILSLLVLDMGRVQPRQAHVFVMQGIIFWRIVHYTAIVSRLVPHMVPVRQTGRALVLPTIIRHSATFFAMRPRHVLHMVFAILR